MAKKPQLPSKNFVLKLLVFSWQKAVDYRIKIQDPRERGSKYHPDDQIPFSTVAMEQLA
jgi:hypothetical protein